MTISTKKIVSLDLSIDNESFNLHAHEGYENILGDKKISAITFLTEELEIPRDVELLDNMNCEVALNFLSGCADLKNWSFYLCIAQGCWQKSNRIVEHKKLWKSLPKDLVINDFDNKSKEIRFELDGMVNFVGAIDIDFESLPRAIKVFRSYRTCFLVLSRANNFLNSGNVSNFVDAAFSTYKHKSINLIDWVSVCSMCDDDNIIVRVSGDYDDRCTAIDLIGLRSVVEPLAI
jgi:hypothetical protein